MVLPCSRMSVAPFLLDQSLCARGGPRFVSDFSLVSFAFSSPLASVSGGVFLSDSSDSSRVLLCACSSER